MGVKTHYLHSEMDTFERVEILRDLRLGVYDVVVGINLLREGLDLPEVSLVAILDADKEGYLRSEQALIQTMGRAARHVEGRVIMYADSITGSMQRAINEINRRRAIQEEYNHKHNITPQGIQKAIKDITERVKASAVTTEELPQYTAIDQMSNEDKTRLVDAMEKQMKKAAKNLDFEKAALLRDRIIELRRGLLNTQHPSKDYLPNTL
jgi:excinuclease ABC subunit B